MFFIVGTLLKLVAIGGVAFADMFEEVGLVDFVAFVEGAQHLHY